MTETPQEPITPPPAASSERAAKVKKIQRFIDRSLNVMLVIAVMMWVTEHYLLPTDKNDNAKNLENLQKEAEIAFGKRAADTTTTATTTAPPPATASHPRPTMPAPAIAFMASDMNSIIQNVDSIPTLVFFYASWCPYCHKMFPTIADIARTKRDVIRVIPISIDEKPDAFVTYLQKNAPNAPFTPYVIADKEELNATRELLAKKGLHFKGAIPYMTVFHKGVPLAQIEGVLADKDFYAMIADASKLRDQSKNPHPASTSPKKE